MSATNPFIQVLIAHVNPPILILIYNKTRQFLMSFRRLGKRCIHDVLK